MVEMGVPGGAAAMRSQAERPGVFCQKTIEVVSRTVGGLGGEDFPQQGGSRTHPVDIARGELDAARFTVCAEHIGDFTRVGTVGIEGIDQSSGTPSHGQYGVPGGPVVDGGGHLRNVTHIAEF